MRLRYGPPLRVLVLLGYAAGAALLAWFWLGLDLAGAVHHQRVNVHEKAKLPDMVYGTAHRPYVTRALVPGAVRVLRAALPDETARRIEQDLLRSVPGLRRTLRELGWERHHLSVYLISALLVYACLLGFLFAFRALFRTVYAAPEPAGDLAPFAALGVLPLFFAQGAHYLYDFATLLLFTAGLDALARARWRLFYPLLLLALLNKETAALLTLVFAAAYHGHMDRGGWRRHLAAQIVLILAVRAGLALAFRGNPGGEYEFHLPFNLSVLLRRYDGAGLTFVLLVGFVCLHRFRDKPEFLRHGLLVLPPLLVAYVVFGFYSEIRVFYEVLPIVLLLALHTAAALAGFRLPVRGHEP